MDRKEKTVLTEDIYILHHELFNGCLGSKPILPCQVSICQVCHLMCPFTFRCVDALGPTTSVLSAILAPALIDQIIISPESLLTYPPDLSKIMCISSPSLVMWYPPYHLPSVLHHDHDHLPNSHHQYSYFIILSWLPRLYIVKGLFTGALKIFTRWLLDRVGYL